MLLTAVIAIHIASSCCDRSILFIVSIMVVFDRLDVVLNTFLNRRCEYIYRPASMNCILAMRLISVPIARATSVLSFQTPDILQTAPQPSS